MATSAVWRFPSYVGSPLAAPAEKGCGARGHGGFGSFIPVGIRIGLDTLDRLLPDRIR